MSNMSLCFSLSDIVSMIALAISIGTTIFALVKYYRFDKRIAKQEIKLNLIQLAEAAEKRENSKKANIEITFNNDNKSSGILKVYNRGLSSAENITIEFLGDLTLFQSLKAPLFIERLEHLQNKEHKVYLMSNHPSQLKAKVNWSDDYKKDQTKEVIVFF